MQVKPIVTVMGRSGMGKSSSIRNLDAKSTVIINTEFKPLPFADSEKFDKVVYLEKPEDIFMVIERAKGNDKIEVIVLDSFTQWSHDLVAYCEKTKKGWDRQTTYNNMVYDLFNTLRRSGKTSFVLCHDSVETTSDGETIKQAKVEYKSKKGIVEEASLVSVYATINYDESGENPRYVFQVTPDSKNPAKAPMGMFGVEVKYIDNDLKIILDALNGYKPVSVEDKSEVNPKVGEVLRNQAK